MKTDVLQMNTLLTAVKGIGPKTAELFSSHGLLTVGDMLNYFPRDYIQFGKCAEQITDVQPNQICAVELVILRSGQTVRHGNKQIIHFQAVQSKGEMPQEIRLTWFNMPYIRNVLPGGSIRIFRGVLKQTSGGNYYMEQPQIFTKEEYARLEKKTPAGLSIV